MNEQIQKFAEQAFLFASATDDSDESDANWWKEYNEKFAELIVRDCMSICKQHPSRIVSNNWNADAVAPDIVHRFEEHFGVEE